MVEAFRLRGLARLRDEQSKIPPFSGGSSFGTTITVYRQDTLEAHARHRSERIIRRSSVCLPLSP